MPQYTKRLVDDGPEYYWMKRILERDTDQIYLVDRGIALICIAAYMWQRLDLPFSSGDIAKDHLEAWNAFLNGNRSLLQREVESHIKGQELMRAMAKEELGNPAVRLRILIYVIVTIVIVIGAAKVFGY